jgi:hypothetical protein
MAGTSWRAGPAFLPAAVANIANVNPIAGTWRKIFQIHLANQNAANRSVTLYVGATGGSAANTEIVPATVMLPNTSLDFYFPAGHRIDVADFLTGLSSVDGTSVTIEVIGESFTL